ncbi:MAG: EFR1 family ferrodoxin [Prolixibacteraceae bacterium]|nr:EFR1 family ferrodoxin [Prolixibacteraceae bacterium]
MINKVNIVCFSPTKTSEKISKIIAQGSGIKVSKDLNITHREENYTADKDELTIFAFPVYGGRIPEIAIQRLKKITGNNSPAVLVVVYGNRHYDDALLELQNIVYDQGFKSIAGAAFIGEHSYSTNEYPIAIGRPDKEDIDKALSFGNNIGNLIKNNDTIKELPNLPGKYPYKERSPQPLISPVTIDSKCIKCTTCVTLCPTGAIQIKDMPETNPSLCILCCACIKGCPSNARLNTNDFVLQKQQWLLKNCVTRKEPETFEI